MSPQRGAPRKLSDSQVKTILAWHHARQQFRRQHGTLAQLAQRLGVSPYAVSWCIARLPPPKAWTRRRVTVTPRQRRQILAWHRSAKEFRRRHGTIAQLARRLGVSVRTVQSCIARAGRYRQRAIVESHDWRNTLLQSWQVRTRRLNERSVTFSGNRKTFGVCELLAPLPITNSLGCACVWFLIRSVETTGVIVEGLAENGDTAHWLIPYTQITRLLPAGALRRRIDVGRARISRDGRAALMRSAIGF